MSPRDFITDDQTNNNTVRNIANLQFLRDHNYVTKEALVILNLFDAI